jgi:hypothetical protein
MFGKQTRRHQAERIAGQAWDHLTSAVDTAESNVRSAKRRAGTVVDDTSSRIGKGGKEARLRAHEAYEALMGRRHRRGTSWGWLAAATAAGAAIGWVVTTYGRRALAEQDLTVPDSAEDFIRTGA